MKNSIEGAFDNARDEILAQSMQQDAERSLRQTPEAVTQLEADLTSGFWFRVDEELEIERFGLKGKERSKVSKLAVGDQSPYQPETYDVNNGVIAVITKSGKVFVTPFTKERLQLVETAYKPGSIPVVFSNGEVPADERLRQQWEDLETVARAEQIKEKIIAAQKI